MRYEQYYTLLITLEKLREIADLFVFLLFGNG